MCKSEHVLIMCGIMFMASILCGVLAMFPQQFFPAGVKPMYFLILAAIWLVIGAFIARKIQRDLRALETIV